MNHQPKIRVAGSRPNIGDNSYWSPRRSGTIAKQCGVIDGLRIRIHFASYREGQAVGLGFDRRNVGDAKPADFGKDCGDARIVRGRIASRSKSRIHGRIACWVCWERGSKESGRLYVGRHAATDRRVKI